MENLNAVLAVIAYFGLIYGPVIALALGRKGH